jgi:succinoglycan biosynthesis transport protein ExoP
MNALRGASGLTSVPPAGMAANGDGNGGVRPMPSGNHEQVFFHFDFLRSLRMHRKLAFTIFAFTLLAAAAYVARGWNNYTAQALVYVQPAPPRLLQTGPENRWPYDANTYESYIEQQIHNVTRPDVLSAAAQKIPGWVRNGENPQLAASRLGRALEVTRVGTGYQISITAKAKSAEKAAQIANAAAASYIESATRELRAGDDQRIQLLQEERERVQAELDADRAEQNDLNKKLGVASLGGAPVDPVDQQIEAVRAELIKARADNDDAAARLMARNKGGAPSTAALDAEADELVSADAGMVSMKTALNARRSQLITQMANLTPNHPLYKQDQEELTKINSSLETMTNELRAKAAAHIQQKLKNDLERTSDVEARLNAQLGQLTAEAGTAGPRLQRLNELGADIQRLQGRFALVDEQYRNLALENHAPGAVYLSAAAVAPLGASRDLVFRSGLVILLGGLLFGWGAAILAHNLDPRIYVAKDVERVLGFMPMAQLPDFAEVGTGVEEEYLLRLAAALEHAHQQGALKSCIFTGVAPGSGATTVATRVTAMLEAMGRSTVLVDASGTPVPAPEAESRPEAESGLVPAPRGSRSTALLQQMAEEAGEDTIVLSDTAPLLVSGETEYLARFVDSAIVVIQSGVTTKSQLRDVAHTLQRLDVSAVGFVLNRISKETANPSFRDAVRAVEQRIYGPGADAREKDKPKAARPKKNTRGDDREPPEGEQRAKSADAPAPSRMVAPDPVVQSTAQSAPLDPPMPTPQPVFVVESTPTPVSFAEPQERAERLAERVEEPASSTQLRGRPLRQSAQPRAEAPARAEVRIPEPEPPRVAPMPPPVFAPETAREAVPAAVPPVVEKQAPAPAASHPPMAGANPAAVHGLALQMRSSAPEGDLREVPYGAARLGGLRSLLVSLGLRSLNNKDADLREAETSDPRHERAPERPAERPVYAEPLAPLATSAQAHAPTAEPVEVVATPEFLPPKPMVEITEKEPEKEQARPAAPPRKNRWDSTDDVDTLPSWRGQYRKKR